MAEMIDARAGDEQVSASVGVDVEPKAAWPIGKTLYGYSFGLKNGLTIVVVPDSRAPVFAYQSWFGVGSRDEEPHRTGLAHLFEHLMFKGTTTFPSGTFDAEMERRGAQTNAATWVDWTYYTQALACRADNLETVIRFESDRMVNLVLDEATFASELEVVKNERRLSVEDNIGGLLGETLMELAFERHPYRWPTIGSMAHLEAASVADLEAFYRQHYAPNNCTIVLVGDVALGDALEKIAGAYAPLAPVALRSAPKEQEPPQTERRLKKLYRPVMASQLVVGFRAPKQAEVDHLALEMLADILTAGDTGRLHHRLVTEKRLASEVSGFLTPFSDPGLLELHITANPEASVTTILAEVEGCLTELTQGLHAHEILKAQRGLTLGHLDSIKDVEGLAEALGHHQVTLGDASRVMEALGGYSALGEQELVAVAKRYLVPEQMSVVTVEPPRHAGEPS